MAINPLTKYPTRVDPADSEYPHGKARNRTAPGNGTPFDEALVNDYFGFDAALLDAANITPSGNPDTALDSERLRALATVFGAEAANVTDMIAGLTTSGETLVHAVGQRWSSGQTRWEVINTPVTVISDFMVIGPVYAADFKIDAVTDHTQAVYDAISSAVDSVVYEGDFTLSSAAPYSTAFTVPVNVYMPVITESKLKIEAAGAKFNVTYDFVTNTTNAALFAALGSNNVTIDKINCYGVDGKSQYNNGVEPLVITDDGTNGSHNIKVGGIDCKYVANSVRSFISGGDAEYQLNGFDSVQRSSVISVDQIKMENQSTLSLAGYGITLQFSGDGFRVGIARLKNYHRALIAYGVRDVTAKIWGTDNYAASLSIGSYGSVLGCKVKLKEDGQDAAQATASNIAQILAYDIGTSGGSSEDLQAGRVHEIKDIAVEFDVSVASRSALCYLGKEADAVSDSNIEIEDIRLSGSSSGLSSSFRIAQTYISGTVLWANTKFKNIRLSGDHEDSGQGVIRPGFLNSLIIDDFVGNSFFLQYETSPDVEPVVMRNVKFSDLTGASHKDLKIVIENSHINPDTLTNIKLQTYNKKLINTVIGNSVGINKEYSHIFTDIANSKRLYDPQFARNNLVGGKWYEGSNTDVSINLDLVAATAAAKPTSTTAYDIDHDSFVSVTDYVNDNLKAVRVYVRNTSASIAAVYTGHLSLRGPALTDFSSCVVSLVGLQVTNIVGSSYLVGDLTVSAVDADTLRFSMSRGSESLSVQIYEH